MPACTARSTPQPHSHRKRLLFKHTLRGQLFQRARLPRVATPGSGLLRQICMLQVRALSARRWRPATKPRTHVCRQRACDPPHVTPGQAAQTSAVGRSKVKPSSAKVRPAKEQSPQMAAVWWIGANGMVPWSTRPASLQVCRPVVAIPTALDLLDTA